MEYIVFLAYLNPSLKCDRSLLEKGGGPMAKEEEEVTTGFELVRFQKAGENKRGVK